LVYFGWVEDDPAMVRARYEEALLLYRGIGDRWGIGYTLALTAAATLDRGDYLRATVEAEEALALLRDVGDRQNIAYTLWALSMALLYRGGYAQARGHLEESLAISHELGHVVWGAYFLLRAMWSIVCDA
jgi:hypothetical protein